jgi:hypothetical protein
VYIGGLTLINAALMADGTIQQGELRINTTAIGELDGRISPRSAALKTAFEAGGIPVQVSDNCRAMGEVLQLYLYRDHSLLEQIARRSNCKLWCRSVLRLRRYRGMHASSDSGRVSSAARYGGHDPRDIFSTKLDLWTVHASRH